ncbi:hypothetical protein N0V90_001581 [Kalmusia sp. IMI 367209]|nr:hypothetical protein N0V90_001581 [Kalmusia sp. IMI 367209]
MVAPSILFFLSLFTSVGLQKEEDGERTAVMDDIYGSIRTPTEPLPPYSPWRIGRSDSTGESEFLDEKKENGIVIRIARTWTRTATTQIAPAISSSARTTSHFVQYRTWPAIKDSVQHRIWPAIKNYPLKKRQAWGFFLVILIGIAPFVTYGKLNDPWDIYFYYGAFAAKTIGCGDLDSIPQNSTVEGVEALFVLDWKFGQFTFSQVKTIDVAWDILVGRGVQMAFWAVSYRVFTDALLRLIERHPASYETFMSISLEGPCLASSWMLLKQLFRNRSKRTWFLFYFMLLSSIYVLSIPPLLGAMTGYDSRTIAWVSVGDPDNIIPASTVQSATVVYGTWNSTFDEPICDTDSEQFDDWWYHMQDMRSNCHFNFTGNDKFYDPSWGLQYDYAPAKNWGVQNCNDTYPITLKNTTYSMYNLNFTASGTCWLGKPYDRNELFDTARCLPDTANPSYQWGFSSALMGVIFIINITWCISMWVVWQDALLGKLARSGYRMSQLRAAFVLTEAARQRTGVGVDGLVLRESKTLKKELEERRGRREAVIERSVFEEGAGVIEQEQKWMIRRRPVGKGGGDVSDGV